MSSIAAPQQRTEDDAYMAYTLIQSLLNGDDSPFGHSSLQATEFGSPLPATEFGSPLQAIDTPLEQIGIRVNRAMPLDPTHSRQLIQSSAVFTDTKNQCTEGPLALQQSDYRGGVAPNEESHESRRLPNERAFHSLLLNAIRPCPAGNCSSLILCGVCALQPGC